MTEEVKKKIGVSTEQITDDWQAESTLASYFVKGTRYETAPSVWTPHSTSHPPPFDYPGVEFPALGVALVLAWWMGIGRAATISSY